MRKASLARHRQNPKAKLKTSANVDPDKLNTHFTSTTERIPSDPQSYTRIIFPVSSTSIPDVNPSNSMHSFQMTCRQYCLTGDDVPAKSNWLRFAELLI